MSQDNNQALLLERYLETLRTQPDAAPPPGLDADMAAFARQMQTTQTTSAPTPGTQDRVWHRVMSATQASSPNGHVAPTDRQEITHQLQTDEETYMTNTITSPPIRRSTLPYTALAALVAVTIAAVVFVANRGGSSLPPDAEPQFSAAQQDATGEAIFATATEIILTAPRTADTTSGTSLPPTADPFVQTATEIILEATQTAAVTPRFTVTPVPSSSGGGGGGGVPSMDGPVPPSRQGIDYIFGVIPPTEIDPGAPYRGQLTNNVPYATFSYTAPEDMLLAAQINIEGAPAVFQLNIASAPSVSPFGGGGGGGGGGGALQPVHIIELQAGDNLRVAAGIPPESGNIENVPYSATFEEVEPEAVDADESIEGSLGSNQAYRAYSFPVTAGDRLTLRASGIDGFDPRLSLHGGQLFGGDDDSGPGLDAEVYRRTVERTQTGIVVVDASQTDAMGDFSLEVVRDPAPSLNDGEQTANINQKNHTAVFTAQGEPGTASTISIRPDQSQRTLNVQFTDGENVLTTTSGENVSRLLADFTYPQGGTVYIHINAFNGGQFGRQYPTPTTDITVSIAE